MLRDYLKLHFVILLWGFTAVLGKLIALGATQLVFYRAVMATGLMVLYLGRRSRIRRSLAIQMIGNGMLLGLHWVLFFLAVKIANVSICMIGLATVSFWTALLEPLMIPKAKMYRVNFVLSGIVIVAVYLIYRTETEFYLGLIVAVVSALLAAVFSIINGNFSGQADDSVIVMYEMGGVALFCSGVAALGPLFGQTVFGDRVLPTIQEWLWFAILVLACTILAYQIYVELLKRMSVFTINFANNLEPVYGIVLGAIFFGDHERVGPGFYWGTTLILLAVIAQPWLVRRFPK
ncbi:MAG: DMT family transporter [Planctomycetota bacterium]